jgi:hypothetical protein
MTKPKTNNTPKNNKKKTIHKIMQYLKQITKSQNHKITHQTAAKNTKTNHKRKSETY